MPRILATTGVRHPYSGPQSYEGPILDVPGSWISPTSLVASQLRGVRALASVLVLPRRHQLVLDLVVRLRRADLGDSIRLERLNREMTHRVREAGRWFMAIRTLGGFAHMIGAFARDGNPDPELQRRAEALLQELNRHEHHVKTPLEYTHPDYVRDVRRHAESIFDLLGDYRYANAIRALAVDRQVGRELKEVWLGMARNALNEAAYQVSLTPLQAQIGQACQDAIHRIRDMERSIYGASSPYYGEPAPDYDEVRERERARASAQRTLEQGTLEEADALSIANTAVGVLGNLVGNTPFGCDSMAMMLAKVVVGWRTVGPFAFDAPSLDAVRDAYLRWIGRMGPAARQSVTRALRSGAADSVHEAQEILQDRFQISGGYALATAVFSGIQFASLCQDVGANGFTPSNVAGMAQSVAGFGASIHTLLQARAAAVGDARAAATASAEMVEVPRSRWERAAAVSRGVVEHLDRPIGFSFAIVNAIQGLVQLNEGLEQRNYWGATVGALNTASGALCAISFFTTVLPGTQPVGVALGIAAGLIDLGQSAYASLRGQCARTYEGLADAIQSSHPSRPYQSRTFLEQLPRFEGPLEQLVSHLHGEYRFLDRVYLDPRTPALEGRGVTINQPSHALLDRLHEAMRPLGFEENEVRAYFVELAEGGWIGGRRQPS